MINRAIVIRGKTWGARLQRRLDKPPVGIDKWLQQHTTPIKDEGGRYVGHYFMREMSCYLKLYRRPYYLHVLPTLMRRGLPVRTFNTAIFLAANGVPVSRALSCVLVSTGVIVLSEGLYQGGNYFEVWQSGPAEAEARQMMREAGTSLAAMHKAGYVHGDCHWNSLLWSEQQCFLVNLEAARKPRFKRAQRSLRDLAHFALDAESEGVSAALFAEFIEAYVFVTGENRDDVIAGLQVALERLRKKHASKAPRLGSLLSKR